MCVSCLLHWSVNRGKNHNETENLMMVFYKKELNTCMSDDEDGVSATCPEVPPGGSQSKWKYEPFHWLKECIVQQVGEQ